MKCYTFASNSYSCGVVIPGVPITRANNQCYLALPVAQGDPAKIFLTERAIDGIEIENNKPFLRFGRLVLQGDGTYWLDIDGTPTDSIMLLYTENSEWRQQDHKSDFPYFERGRKIVSSRLKIYGHDKLPKAIMRDSTYRGYNGHEVNLLSIFMMVTNGMRIPVSRLTTYREPGTGFSLVTPFRRAVHKDRISIHNSIEYKDGQFTVKDLE